MRSLLIAFGKRSGANPYVDEILQHFPDDIVPADAIILSNREKEILMMSGNMTNKEVSNQLFIAEKTVKSHITNINRKLNVKTKREAVSKAQEMGLI